MSELKAILATPHPKMKNACDGAIEVYLKSEADQVIAKLEDELQAANEQIENLINSASSIMLAQERVNDNKCTELLHYKYKHCLNMADKCVVLCQKSKDLYHWTEDEKLEHYYNHKIEFFARWRKRWLELAEKFKEAK